MKNINFLRPLAMVLCLAMLLGLIPAVSAATDPITVVYDSLQNGDFESDITDLWFPLNSASADKFGKEVTQVKDGTGAIKVISGRDAAVGNYGAQSHLFKVKAGETYTIRCDFKSTHAVATATIAIFYYDANNAQIANSGTYAAQPTNSQSWIEVSFESVAPVGAVAARIILTGNHASGPTEYFDNLSVEGQTDPMTVVYDNLQNGDFEAAITDLWFPLNSASADKFGRETTQVKDGTGAIKVVSGRDASVGNFGAQSHLFKVEAGKTYTVSCDFKSTHDVATATIAIFYYDANNAQIANSGTYAAQPTNSQSWIEVSFDSVAPAGAVTARVVLTGNHANGPTEYFDNLSVEKKADPMYVVYDSLQNGDFEADITELWFPLNSASADKFGKEVTQVKDGTGAIKVVSGRDASVGNYGAQSHLFKVEAGETYTVRCDFKSTHNVATATVAIFYYDANNARVTDPNTFAVQPTNSQSWSEVSFDTTVPAGAVTARVILTGNHAAGPTEYFDNLSVEKKADPMYVVYDSLQNGDFEADITDLWFPLNSASADKFGKEVTQVKDGSGAIKVISGRDASVGNFGTQSHLFKVEAGETYTVSCDFKSTHNVATATVAIFYYDANNAQIANSGTYAAQPTNSQSWIEVSFDSVAPAGAVTARVVLTGNHANGPTEYFDNLSVAVKIDPINVVYDSLQNGDFESDITDLWFPLNSASADKFGKEVTQVKDGTGAIKVISGRDAAVGNYGAQSHLFKVEAGETYTISCDFKSTHAVATATVAIFYYDANGAQIANSGTYAAQPTNSQSWIEVSFDSVAPAGAVAARIILTGNHANGPTEYFDNLSVENVKTKLYAGLQNPSFEQTDASGKLTHWYAFDAESHSQDSEHVTDGSYSMKINDTGIYVGAAYSNLIAVTGGQRYRATIDSYATGGATQAQLYLQFFNAEGTATTTVGKGSGADVAETIVAEAIAPDDAVYARIMPVSYSSQTGVLYFDNATFAEVAPPTYSDTLENSSLEIADPSNEQKADGWNYFGTTTYKTATRTNEMASEGQWSVKMTDLSDTSNTGYDSPAFKVTPGVTYRATADFYIEYGYMQLYIKFYDKNANMVGYAGVDVRGTSTWTKAVVDGDTPVNAVYAILQVTQSVDNIGVAYADNFTVSPYTAYTEWTIQETSHPRLYFTADEIEDIRTRANDSQVNAFGYSNKETFDAILAKADTYLTETEFTIAYYNGYAVTYPSPVVTQPDNPTPPPGYTAAGYPYWTMLAYEIEDRLSYLSLAYTVTGDAKYAEKALEHVRAMAGWNVWSDPYTVIANNEVASLDTAHITMGMSLAYDLLYDYMDETLRNTTRDAIRTKGLAPLYTCVATKGDHNIALVRAAALGIGACAIADPTDVDLSRQVNLYLTRANDFYEWYLNARMTTGVQEGYQYTSYALENLMAAMDIIGRVTGETGLLDNEYFNEVFVDWVVHFMAPGSGTLPGISDSNSAAYFFNTMNILNKSLSDGDAGYYLSVARPSAESLLQKFLYTSTNPVINDPYESLELVYTTDYLGFAALRTGWEENDMLLALIANDSTTTHNHYDQNSFLLATRGTWIATDAGYGNFVKGTPANEWTIRYGHSTLLVDGNTQSIKGNGSVEEIFENTLYGHVVGSAPEAYGEDVLDKFDRHAIIVNHDDGAYYVLFDDIASSGTHNYGWNLNTEGWNSLLVDGSSVTTGSTVTGNSLVIEKSAASMFVDFVGNDPLNITAQMYRDSEGPYITAFSPAAQNYQYMAVISTAVGTNGVPAVSLMNTLQKNGQQETKTVAVDGVDCIFFRAAEVGDWFSVDFNVAADGEYDMSLELPKSTAYGNYQVYIDGEPCGDVYVGYDATVALHDHSLGKVSLTAGEHTLKMELVGKESASSNYLIALGNINFGGDDEGPVNAISVMNTYDTADYLGAKIDNGAGNQDLVLFRRTSAPKTVTVDGLTTDASQVSLLSIGEDGIAEGFAAVGVTSLNYNGTNWITSSSPVNVILDLRDGYARYTIESEVAQSVTINVDVNGTQKTVDVSAGTNEINGGLFEDTGSEDPDTGATIAANGKSLTLNGLVFVNHYGKFTGFEGIDREYIEKNGGLLIWNSAVTEENAVFGYGNADVNEGLIYDRTYTDGGVDYKAQTDGIPMAEYADELYFRIYLKMPDGSYVYGPLQEYSVQRYCENKLNNEDTEESLKNLCAAVLHFGAAAQKEFNHNTGDLANANILDKWPAEAFDSSLLTAADTCTTSLVQSSSVKENGKSLILNGEIQMKYYFKCDFTPASAELLFWQGVEGELSEANVTYRKELTYGNGEYCGYSDGIAFAEYDQTVFACAKFVDADGNAHYGEVVAYSPEVYAANKLSKASTEESLKTLVERMVICGEYAKIHFEN